MVREVVLFAAREPGGAVLGSRSWDVVGMRRGREISRRRIAGPFSAAGTHAAMGEVAVDAIEVRAHEPAGGGSTPAAIGEVEAVARLPDE